jgi:short-subunit dehydrogenase
MSEPAGRGSRWRRALVTGASSGIGEAFAEELASRHVDLVLVARDVDALESVAERARAAEVHVVVLPADLATDDGVARVVAAIRQAAPPIDLLVNNAGLGQWGWFLDLPLDRAVESMRVNNVAVVELTHAAATRMRDGDGGSIIQVASMAAAFPAPQQAVYAASKAFLLNFGQALAQEWAGSGVACTTVLPGLTRTNYFARTGVDPGAPERRWMTAGEVARASLTAAEKGQALCVPGRRNRWKLITVSRYPSLPAGRAKRLVREALRSARNTAANLRRR